MTSSLFVTPQASFRLYNDSTDRASLIEMCRNVYDGQDFIPSMLPSLSTLENAHAFVLPGRSPPAIDAFAYVVALGARDRRCSTYLLAGVRVDPPRRGLGLGRKLVELVEKPLLDLGAERVLATTSEENEPMRRIFEGLGWSFLQEIVVWPDRSLMVEMEGTVLENFSNGGKGSRMAESHAWEPCRSAGELQEALERLAKAGVTGFVPSSYKMILAERLEEECKQGKVWVGKKSGKEVGVVAVFKDWERFVTVVSIRARDADFLEPALSFVENKLSETRYVVAFDGSLDLEKCSTLDFKKCEPEPVMVYQKTFSS